jgi:hypothetical protein
MLKAGSVPPAPVRADGEDGPDPAEKAREIDGVLKADRARRDAEADAGEKLDKAIAQLDALSKRLDAMEAEPPGKGGEKEEEKLMSDAEGDDAGEIKEPGKPRPVIADSARLDAVERHYVEPITDARATYYERLSARDRYDAQRRAALADAQTRADRVYAAHCDSAPRPMDGERVQDYRVRLVRKFKNMSQFKDSDLSRLAETDPSTFKNVENSIYADALEAAKHPEMLGHGEELREVVTTDATGRKISNFYGEPRSWMSQFSGPVRHRLVGINTRRDG